MVFEVIRSAEASASLHTRICFQNLYAPSVSHPYLNLCIHNTIIDSGESEWSTTSSSDWPAHLQMMTLWATSSWGLYWLLPSTTTWCCQCSSIQNNRELPDILHECLQVCLDYQCASIVTLLHSKVVDINKQVWCVDVRLRKMKVSLSLL